MEQNMHLNCEYCTFTSKTERELRTYSKEFNVTHSHLDYNEHSVLIFYSFVLITRGLDLALTFWLWQQHIVSPWSLLLGFGLAILGLSLICILVLRLWAGFSWEAGLVRKLWVKEKIVYCINTRKTYLYGPLAKEGLLKKTNTLAYNSHPEAYLRSWTS